MKQILCSIDKSCIKTFFMKMFLLQYNSWFPKPNAEKTVSPFTILHESESETDIKISNVRILNGEVKLHV